MFTKLTDSLIYSIKSFVLFRISQHILVIVHHVCQLVLYTVYRIVEMQNLTQKFEWGCLRTNALAYLCTSFQFCCCLLYFLIQYCVLSD